MLLCDLAADSKTSKPNTLKLVDEISEKLTIFSGQSLNSALNVFREILKRENFKF